MLQVGLPQNVFNSISTVNMELQTSCTQVFNCEMGVLGNGQEGVTEGDLKGGTYPIPGGTQLLFWYRCAARRTAKGGGELKERSGNRGLKN